MNIIDKLAWIYIKDRKLLVARSKGKDAWFLPGGKREEGETDQQAVIREISEELTVDLTPDTLKHLGTFKAQAYGKPDGVHVQIACYTGNYVGELKVAAEIDAISWLTTDTDESLLTPINKIIFAYLKEKNLID